MLFTPTSNLTSAAVAVGAAGEIYTVWNDPTYNNNTGTTFFAKSTDGAQNWAFPPGPPNSSGYAPTVAVGPNGNIFMAWSTSRDIALSGSTNGGSTFSSPVNVTRVQNSFGIGASVGWDTGVAVDQAGGIHVVTTLWRSLGDGFNDVIYSRSTDGGRTFSGPAVVYENLPYTDSVGSTPTVVARGSNVYIAWQQASGAALFLRSTDWGITFSTALTLGQGGGGGGSCHIGVDGNGVITALWQGADGVIFARSTNNGASFSQPAKVPNTRWPDSSSDLAVDSHGTLYVVWGRVPPEAPSIQGDVFFTRSTDGGATFSVPVNVSLTYDEDSSHPRIAVDQNGNINFVWMETFPTTKLIYRRAK